MTMWYSVVWTDLQRKTKSSLFSLKKIILHLAVNKSYHYELENIAFIDLFSFLAIL